MIIDIVTDKYNSTDLINTLELNKKISDSKIKFVVPDSERSDAVTIQAICALSGVVLGALIKGLFDLGKNKITVEISNDKEKTKIEIPVNFNLNNLEKIIQKVKGSLNTKIFI